jgi:hypothetical protein
MAEQNHESYSRHTNHIVASLILGTDYWDDGNYYILMYVTNILALPYLITEPCL